MTNAGPYLILHLVRGEPAFDIAEQMQINDETWWIIPTSGHRAYPWRSWPLEDLSDISDINDAGYHSSPINFVDKVPADWPDHYTAFRPGIKLLRDLAALGASADELAAAIKATTQESQ